MIPACIPKDYHYRLRCGIIIVIYQELKHRRWVTDGNRKSNLWHVLSTFCPKTPVYKRQNEGFPTIRVVERMRQKQ